MNFRDVEHLSAYVDGKLSPSDVTRLESRLAVDESLRRLLDDLRVARGLLRRVPRRAAPRNFTLSPLNARVRAPQPLAVPVLRYAGAIASLLFVFTVGLNTLGPMAARSLAQAPVPGFGMGGGGGGAGDEQLQAEMQAAEVAGTPEVAPAAPAAPLAAMPTAEAFAKAAPTESVAADEALREGPAPIAPIWVMIFALAAIVLIGLGWYLDRITRRNFRSRELER